MTLTDTRLSDPTAKEIHTAIADAFRAVSEGGGGRVLHSQASVKRVAASAAARPEGLECWASRAQIASGAAGQVMVAWWTAVSGRRHVRVIGRTVALEANYLLNETTLGTRPSVWHVFPDRVYRRRAGKANDLVAVCGCGAIGTERALGWAGPCCGPCLDFREEHGALPWKRPALLPTPESCLAVAGSADGRWVAAAHNGGAEVRVWDIEAAGEPVHVWRAASPDGSVAHLGLSPDGRYLALAGRANQRFRILDLREEPPRAAVQMAEVEAVAFHPGGAMYFTTGGTVLVASPPDARATGSGVSAAGAAETLVFGRAGSCMAVRCGPTVRIYEPNGTERMALPLPRSTVWRFPSERDFLHAAHVAFSPDGGQVAMGLGQALAVYHAVTGEQRFLDSALEAEVSGVAFDPGGTWLYVGRRDGSLIAHHTDTFAPERSVVFRWSLGPIRAMARCGDALLTACDEGVQIWPMAKLLEGL